ncbi:MAG: tryptophan synthase subunit alpha, partial [Spirochaetota bacterium]
ARGLVRGGAALLEVQFPFSDPTADGPVIQTACHEALESGFTVDAGFDFVRKVANEVRSLGREVPIYVMTYASLLYARGVRRFLADGVAAGATGFILPDVPVDYDEGAWDAAEEVGAKIMPVTVTSAGPDRLSLLAERNPEHVYVALRRGITGARTEIGEGNLRFLDQLRSTGAKVLAGFGISDREQVVALEQHVFGVVVGSAFVRTVTAHAQETPEAIAAALEAQVAELAGR